MLVFLPGIMVITASDGESVLPPEKNRMKPDHAPTPFSAEEIRDACPTGRWTKYHIQVAGHPDTYQLSTFIDSDNEGTGFESVSLDMDGKPKGEKQTARANWKELQGHASFPQKDTQITSESYTTPSGTYDCWLYVVTREKEGKKDVKRFWFAKSLPGPPVCYEQTVNGKLTFRMTLVESHIPAPSAPGD